MISILTERPRKNSPALRGSWESRFWNRVHKTGECWLWLGKPLHGYGQIEIEGRSKRAHRVSWELHNGPIPDGLDVLHSCDFPLCVRPTHLFLGTQADNMADMAAKGRSGVRGTLHHLNKRTGINAVTVVCIRHLIACGISQKVVAETYGVSAPVVHAIHKRKTWKHV